MLPHDRSYGPYPSWICDPTAQRIGDLTIFKIHDLYHRRPCGERPLNTCFDQSLLHNLDDLSRWHRIRPVEKKSNVSHRDRVPSNNFDAIFHQITIWDKDFFTKACHDGGMSPLHLHHLSKHVLKL